MDPGKHHDKEQEFVPSINSFMLKSMTPLVPLRTFLEAYRTGSLSRAADTLGITQPAVSGHIRLLEDQMGRPLFERLPRGVRATAAGEELAVTVSGGYDAIESGFAMLRARSEAVEGTVRIAGPSEFTNVRMAEPVAELGRLGLEVRLTLGGREVIYDALDRGDVDLAVTASRPRSRALGFSTLQDERLIAIASPSWIDRNGLKYGTLAEALAYPPIAYDHDLPHIAQFLEQEGIDVTAIRPSHIVPDLRLISRLVEAGVGWSVVPDYLCIEGLERRSLTSLRTAGLEPTNRLYLVWRKSSLREPRIAYAKRQLERLLA